MQYDARQRESSKNGKAEAEPPNNAPLLRERLLDVVRRDRETAIAQRAAQRAALAGGAAPGDTEAKSGTHARLPDYARSEPEEIEARARALELEAGARARELELESELDQLFELDEPTHSMRAPAVSTAWSKQAAQPPVAPIDLSEAQSLFASWIEEIVELDGASERPLQYPAEPPPVAAASGRAAVSVRASDGARAAVSARAPEGALRPAALPPVDLKKFARKKPSVPQTEEHAAALQVVESLPAEAGLELTLEPEPTGSTATEEPIRTRTMARLLAGHGYNDRALSIYDHLIARDPADVSLRVEADALRALKKK